MTTSGFQWVVSPSQQLIPAINKYGADALVAVQAVANYWGQYVQDEARQEASWEDRTANARGGLFFAVDGFGLSPLTGTVTPDAKSQMSDVAVESGDKDTLIITLGHTVFYGKYLESPEFIQGGKYAVVMSTIERNLPKLERMLIDSLR
jgi:hypothetical protein